MNLVSVSYRYIGIGSIYRYRFDMGDFGDIGIGLNILLTDTDILVSANSSIQRRKPFFTLPCFGCIRKDFVREREKNGNSLIFDKGVVAGTKYTYICLKFCKQKVYPGMSDNVPIMQPIYTMYCTGTVLKGIDDYNLAFSILWLLTRL